MDSSSPAPLHVMDFSQAEDFGEGLVLLVDKPLHWTSFDVVNKLRGAIRGALGYRKIKVGHAGTLDPLASGVLVVCTGKATKRIAELQSQDKEYAATIRLGATTACLDAELPVEAWVDASALTKESIQAAADQWSGHYFQMPPVYSAKKVDGQKAYAVARKGGEINLRPAAITVPRFEVHAIEHLMVDGHAVCDVTVTIACTKGTYIRALARDVGETLAVGGHLVELRRTINGPFKLDACQSLEQILEVIHGLPPLAVDL
ncbi:MAG: tRNA pseudouridine(55) synthase TruB [Bacteroidetes bacterium]|jgi:tRNA pseudouridine55 synthase|nr:tRNA pseudouridine(55) synthase TruB [Bacteroidota bacterium]